MNVFSDHRRAFRTREHAGRRWLFVPYDQLSHEVGPLSRLSPNEVGIVLVENVAKARRRPYHKQKLALVLTNLRHFAAEQHARGVAVEYVFTDRGYAEALERAAEKLGPLECMEPAERELRAELAPLVREGLVTFLPHEGWLTSRDTFVRSQSTKAPWRMDAFYRAARLESGLLVERGKPAGGKWSFDAENRRPWRGDPPAPPPPTFEVDAITAEVGELVRTAFASHPGDLDLASIPASSADHESLWARAKASCLDEFGPFEDAMSVKSRTLFHSLVSASLNLGRLSAKRLVNEAAEHPSASLASREGFVRQILGWREFVRHVHRETDGFRVGQRGEAVPSATQPGDGGYSKYRAWTRAPGGDGGASPSSLGAARNLPAAFWGEPSGLACLDRVVSDVWATGYSHHITRLMVLSNLATLLDLSPREVTDWFWVAYTDAYDWVVEPNVLGMGTYAAGEVMTTKPYVSGAAYIDKMGDYCKGCAFDPKKTCPITRLYWAFLARNGPALATNHRLAVPLAALSKRSTEHRARDTATFEVVSKTLAEGRVLRPSELP
jgi:deoxyribodipyrimidine photolyase-related protein